MLIFNNNCIYIFIKKRYYLKYRTINKFIKKVIIENDFKEKK